MAAGRHRDRRGQKRNASAPAFVFALGMAFGGACGAPCPMRTSAHAAEGEIVVAIVNTVRSPHQPHGTDVGKGVRAGLARALGAEPRLFGLPLRTIEVSDDCTRAGAEVIARALVSKGPAVVIGHLCAVAAIATAPIYAAAGILFIATGVRHPRLTEQRAGSLVFRMAGREDRLAHDAVAYLRAALPDAPLAILHDRAVESVGIADAVDKAATAAGRKPVLREAYVSAEVSYDALAARVKASGTGVVFMPGQTVELGILLQRLDALDVKPKVLASERFAVPGLESALGQHAADVTVLLPWPGPSPDDVSLPHRLGVAAAEAWARAALRSGAVEGARVAAALTGAPHPTALGPVRFDAKGDAEVPSYIPHAFRDGRFVPVEPPARPSPAADGR